VTDLDLHRLVEEVVEFFGKQARSKGSRCGHIDAGFLGAAGRPGAGASDLGQSVGNALKFTERRGYGAGFGAEDRERRFSCVRGCRYRVGITPEALSRIFHAFSQADGSTTRKYGERGWV